MEKIGERYQSADWKSEKHVPVIDCPGEVERDVMFNVEVTLGKEVAHPNTTDHHIRWIQLFFKPDDDKFTYQVGNFEFTAHGESADGADKGPVYTNPSVINRHEDNQIRCAACHIFVQYPWPVGVCQRD